VSDSSSNSQPGVSGSQNRISSFFRTHLTHQRRVTLTRILALLAVIALSVFVFSIRDQAERLAVYGYPGIFVLSFLAYATVLLPAPGVAVVFTMASVFNPIGVAIAAGSGAALGELSGYLAGYSGQAVIERADIYERLTAWMKRNGSLTVFFLAAIPNPFFDLAGVAAGSLQMPVARFLLFCWMGEVVKMGFFAFAGSRVLDLIT
jgi:membrane protein YqaA with SNARE-associated domain